MFIQMMQGPMMQHKQEFEKYFMLDFLLLVNDRVPNVRINFAKALRHHFLKEISGVFVYDPLFNDAIRLLKKDACLDVRSLVIDIETYPVNDNKDVNIDDYLNQIEHLKKDKHASDSDSSYSEDDSRIEMEVRRHNSEEEIDHGPVLQSLRQSREQAFMQEQEVKKFEKEQRKREKS
jgi:hypothetical protein